MVQCVGQLSDIPRNMWEKFKHFLCSRNKWKVTFKTFTGYFKKRSWQNLRKMDPCIAFCHELKIIKFQKHCVIPFGFKKGKTWNLVVCSSELHLVFGWIYSILGTERDLLTCIVDRDWRMKWLPWLDRALLCLVGVGLKWVYWAARYLDRPPWRAVSMSQGCK